MRQRKKDEKSIRKKRPNPKVNAEGQDGNQKKNNCLQAKRE
jgi:hypothetical protein